jgi:hypothetical protein
MDRPSAVAEAALADPPCRVGREAEAALGIELVYGAHEAGVAFLLRAPKGSSRPRHFLATFTSNLRYLCAGFTERSVCLGPNV